MKQTKFNATKIDISHTSYLTLLLGILIVGFAATACNCDDDIVNDNAVGSSDDYPALAAASAADIDSESADADADAAAAIVYDNDAAFFMPTHDSEIIAASIADIAADIDNAIDMIESTNLQHHNSASPPATNYMDDGIVCPSAQDDNSFVVQFASPSDCSVFYKCNRGVPNLIKCPGGLHYNAEIEACDFPVRAKCQLINVI